MIRTKTTHLTHNISTPFRILWLMLFLLGTKAFTQVIPPQINAGPDQTICLPNCATLSALSSGGNNTTGYSLLAIPYAPEPFTVGNPIALTDDAVSAAQPIGFTFCFYGNNYTQFYIGSNGWISFSPGQPVTFTSAAIPNAAGNVPKNCIMGPWQDWHPGIAGGPYIRYTTQGVAPNRRLIVSFNQIPFFQCTATRGTFQIILYEGSNVIESHIASKPFCGWAGGTSVHGIHNLPGNQAVVVPGRNSTQWTANNDSWRWVPNGNPTIQWYNGAALVGNGPSINVCPTVTTTYEARLIVCNLPVATDQVTVNVGANPTVTIAANGPTSFCPGGNVDLEASAGPGFSYQWYFDGVAIPGATNTIYNATGIGDYTVIVTDAVGCSGTSNVITVSQPPVNTTATVQNLIDVTCNGLSDGSFSIDAQNGIAPYTYSLDGGAFSVVNNYSNLAAGNYVVEIADANGCTIDINVTVSEPPVLSSQVNNQIDVLCHGGNTGSFSILGQGGTAPYQYSFNNGAYAATNTFNNLTTGNYQVTIQDANGCTVNETVQITQPAAPLSFQLDNQTHILCFGANTGAIQVSGNGGTNPYQYSNNNSAFGANNSFNNLVAGNYNIVIQDANGCTVQQSITLTQPAAALSGSIANQTNVLCNGASTGVLQINASNGSAPYTFDNAGTSNSTGQFNNLAAGNYAIVVTDANNCTVQVNANITQPASFVAASIAAQTNVLCSGTSTGSFTITANSGTQPYTFTLAGNTNSTGSFSNLPSGIFTVTVTDNNGCTTTLDVNLTSPNALSAVLNNQVNVLCFGNSTGSLSVSGVNGTGPYSYSLNGNTNANGSYSNLAAGSYDVIVTDQNNCTFTQNVVINQPAAALGSSITAQQNVSCNGGNNASFTVTASGGTNPYSYTLNGNTNATGSFSNLAAGNYAVNISDNNGCNHTQNVTITEPAVLSASTTSTTNVDCFGNTTGAFSLSANGGSAPYNFSIPGQTNTTGNFSTLAAGNYTATITDANGCTNTQNVNITEPASTLSLSIANQINVTCFGGANGSVTLNASGGTATYQYAIQGTPYGNQATIGNLQAQAYTFVVVDQNGCTAQTNATLTQPAVPVSVTLNNQTNILCFGASTGGFSVSASNGIAPYQYSITGSNNATGVFSNLSAGNFTVTATDANNCTGSLVVTLNQPAAPISITVSSQQNPVCNGNTNGSITVAASGGTAVNNNYAYNWNTTPVQNTATASNLGAGTYTVTVTDDNNCTQNQQVTLTQPNFQINLIQNSTICEGQSVNVTATSVDGAAPIVYTFTNTVSGQTENGSTVNLSPVSTTLYQVTAVDNNGCPTGPVNFTVNVNPLPNGDFNANLTSGCQPLCVEFLASSSIPGSAFVWNFGNGLTASGIDPVNCYADFGLFDVSLQITSPNGCSRVFEKPELVLVHKKPMALFELSSEELLMSNPELSVINQSDLSNTFVWNFGDGSEPVTDAKPRPHTYLASGVYCVQQVVTSYFGCVDSISRCLIVKPDFKFFIPSAFTPNNDGLNDLFRPMGEFAKQIEMNIYDKWGKNIYRRVSSTYEDAYWDGSALPNGVYVYYIRVWDETGKERVYSGDVSLLR
jgi:gliding motility-associated-like protein